VFNTRSRQGVSDILYKLADRGVVVPILTNLESVPDRLDLARRVADVVPR